MTVGNKNTELGYDLGQKVLDSGVKVMKYEDSQSNFLCYRIEGAIPADENQLGSKENFYYFDSARIQNDGTASQSIIDTCAAWTGVESKATIEATYKLWLAEQTYTEKDAPNQISEVV